MTCYEGMKCYYGVDEKIRLFRPWDNMERFKKSMGRLGFDVSWNSNELQKCIEELIKLDKDWIPQGYGQSLYVRPWSMSLFDHLEICQNEDFGIFCVIFFLY